ncbi:MULTISPECIES: hypothetical protein [unclassified Methylobacterium]|uniref:hypothetical protein n=1 Tax=unclassified Methylobacterium TaxID=2615210 RepID=UPI0036FF05FD
MKTALMTAGTLGLALATLTALSLPATAQSRPGTVRTDDGSVTGGRDRGGTVSRGPSGADTITRNSAAGGNANQPERAVPQGSGGGGSGNGGAQ